jgi:uncharacterized membrane protein HdeD (DUF308 family)
MVYLGGAGVITAFRGIQVIWGTPPTGYIFFILGDFFVTFWGWTWIVVGTLVVITSLTGHRHPDWDRLAAFSMLMLWWVWGFIYLASAIFDPIGDRRALDISLAIGLIFTGIVLSAGVIQGLRKTHEIWIRQQAEARIVELEDAILKITEENQLLRGEHGLPPREEDGR